mmetsp:Transcript_33569/g.101343  ORF Transcript_33569/g.101343 Transcript_33569/m.101343 type:complete len:361 (+) Transcript_33569:83-1165(+)
MFSIDWSHCTLPTSWSPNMGTISETGVDLVIFAPVTFMYTSHLGGFISDSTPRSAASNFSLAGCISRVWKAPDVLSSLACMRPSVASAFFWSASIAPTDPEHVKPLGKRKFAIWHTSCSLLQESRHKPESTDSDKPATEIIACGDASAASCMASPRAFTSRRPASKLKTPATVRAVYSPSERPATALHRETQSGLSAFSFSMAAKPPMYSAGWAYFVSCKVSSGPSTQILRMSYPKTRLAVSSISLTAGRSFTSFSIPTLCEPWPGKSRPTGSASSTAARAAGASATDGSSAIFGGRGLASPLSASATAFGLAICNAIFSGCIAISSLLKGVPSLEIQHFCLQSYCSLGHLLIAPVAVWM